MHDFFVTRTYDPQRDLLASLRADWDAATVTRHDYTHDTSGRRISRAQSGSAFADYGEPTFRRYTYNARSEVTAAPDYLGSVVTDTTKPLPGRQHAYDFDSLGNRKWADRTGDPTQREDYTTNALNQIVTKENLSLPAQGTVDSATTTVSADGAPATARQGRFFSSEVLVANSANPWAGNVTVHATKNVAGVNYVRTDTRLAFLPQAAQAFTYDLDGNMTSDGLWTYTFDADAARKRGDGQASRLARKGESSGCPPGSEARQNRLTTMTAAVGAVTGGFQNRRLEFQYDYLGRRVQKTVQEWSGAAWSVVSARRFLYDGFNLVGEFSSSDLQSFSLLRSYTWGLDLTGGLTAAGGVGGLVQIRDTVQGKTLLPSYDGNGHVASLVNADTGTLEAAYEYDPFGQILRAEGAYAKENPFRFSTQFVDDETGLVYHNARYYNPNLGRFINRDPIEESGGLNLYAYVSNDSANKWDVLGRMGRGAEIIAEDGGINDVTNELTTWLQTEIAKQSAIAQAFGDPVSEVLGRLFGPIDSSPVERAAAQAEAEFVANFNAVVDFQHALGRAGLGRDDSDPSLVGKTVEEVAGILNIPNGRVTIGPVNVVDDDVSSDAIAPKSPSEVAAATPDKATTKAAPSTTSVPASAAPTTALNTAQNTNADSFWGNATDAEKAAAIHAAAVTQSEFAAKASTNVTFDAETQAKIDSIAAVAAGVDGAIKGALAGADGFIPVLDPFAKVGAYDPNDRAFQASQVVGGVTREIVLVVNGGPVAAIARSNGTPLSVGQRMLVGEFGPGWTTVLTSANPLAPGTIAVDYFGKWVFRIDLVMDFIDLSNPPAPPSPDPNQ